MRVNLQPAFVLHHRPYRETSVLLDLFTQEYGLISAVARGVRQARSRLRSLLQPFVSLTVSWQGKGELMTLVGAEASGILAPLTGECLLSGFYVNELLMRLLQKYDPHPQLYRFYHDTLIALQHPEAQHKPLRLFEKKLLEELGYGLPFKKDIVAEKYYEFFVEQGFEEWTGQEQNERVFSGKSLLALADEQLNDKDCLQDAKKILRLALTPLLGGRALQSRRLYMKKLSVQRKRLQT